MMESSVRYSSSPKKVSYQMDMTRSSPNMTIKEEQRAAAVANSSPGVYSPAVILDVGHGTREIGRNNSMFDRNNSTASVVRVSVLYMELGFLKL
jgi:hypothetical protein